MATIKSFTSLEQSKKLAEVLPLESADMYYCKEGGLPHWKPVYETDYFTLRDTDFPSWSLSTLLDVLPTKLQIVLAINDFQGDRKEKYVIGSVEHDKYDCYADNPVDACYEMIIRLHELKML